MGIFDTNQKKLPHGLSNLWIVRLEQKDVIIAERRGIMSFASRTKKELTQIDEEDCCTRSEIAAFIRMNGQCPFQIRIIKLRCPN